MEKDQKGPSYLKLLDLCMRITTQYGAGIDRGFLLKISTTLETRERKGKKKPRQSKQSKME